MSYQIPAATALDFDLAGDPYAPNFSGGQVDFDLAAGAQPPGITYPIPPDFMVTSSMAAITLTSTEAASRTSVGYKGSPGQRDVQVALRSGKASTSFAGRASQGWDKLPIKDETADWSRHAWGAGSRRDPRATRQRWDPVPIKDELRGGASQAWDSSIRPIGARSRQSYNVPPFKDALDLHPHKDSAKYWEPPPEETSDLYLPGPDFSLTATSYAIPEYNAVDFNLGPEGLQVIEVEVPTRPVGSRSDLQGWDSTLAADLRMRHPWDSKPRKGTEVEFEFDQEAPLPDKPPAPAPEIKEAYLIMNASSLKKLPEGTPLEFSDLSITLDIDSFSWALSCTILNRASMDEIRPGPSGPVEVEAMVNNKTWRFMVERYTLERKFPKETYRVTGSSVTQLLASPYSAKISDQVDTPTNALQVCQDVLDLTGFTLDWDLAGLPDYTIPAGAWGYQDKAPIEVIDELVKAAGGILIPTLSLSELVAHQRYREGPPWYWPQIDSSRLDFQIADSTILGLSSQWEPAPEYNGVYVSGITHGVAVEVRKNGTIGDKAAPDNYDALNLETDQCRARGISILGQSGAQEIVTIEIPVPVSGAPGLVIPGQWGEIQDTQTPANSWRALVLSNAINVSQPGASRATQTIRLERHHYD